tara:strand:+ start:508 stop:1218 length:711 start_codon:yes stop_codon:yes gene_type:complete
MKSIFYTVCSYLPEDKQIINNLIPNVNGMRKWAKYKGIDFKVFDEIPIQVEELFQQVQKKWKKVWGNNRKNHMRKAWLTKFEAFHHFYKNDYDQMLFLDCDMRPRNPKMNKLTFDYTNFFSCNEKARHKDINAQPVVVAERLLGREIDVRAGAQTMYVTKDFKHNISDVFSYENVLNACIQDYRCIREETFMTYMLHKLDIMKEVKGMPVRLNCMEIHRPDKIHFVYKDEWEQIIK